MLGIGMKQAKNFAIHNGVFEHVHERWIEYKKLRHESITMSSYINRILMDECHERDKLIDKIFPHLSLIGVNTDKLYVHDNKGNKLYRVSILKDSVKCVDDHDSKCCEHVMFSYMCPELARLYNSLYNS